VKKLLAMAVAVCVLMSMLAYPAFAKKPDMPFTDVKEADWFYSDVAGAYQTGLVNGKTETEYKPNDNMTYAEAIKLAACMHQYVEDGEVSLKNGDPWYQTYVNYAKDNGIISKDYNYNDNASRSGYMEIFANCMELPEINYIEEGSIPDVKSTAAFAPAVYKLYRAGILTGVDADHNCNPYDNIKRSEVAAILTRMMDEDARKEFTMGDPENAPTAKPEATEAPTEKPTKEPKKLDTKAVPEEAVAKVGESVTLKAVATGGTAPYTYEWGVMLRTSGGAAKVKSNSEFFALDSAEVAELGFPEAEADEENGTLTFTVDDRSFFTKFRYIHCKVTDAAGTEQTVTTEMKYGGSDKINDLTTDTFLMYVEDIFWITDRGLVATGRITNGKVKPGDALKLMKNDGTTETVTVERIEMFKKTLDEAKKGDNVGLLLQGLGNDSETAKAKIDRGEALIGYNDKLVPTYGADITLTMKTKDEGGKSSAVSGDEYTAQAYFGYTDRTVVLDNWVEAEDGNWTHSDLVPGETYDEVNMWFKSDELWAIMYPGMTGEIREGGKTFATFTVNEVWVD